MSDAVEIDAGSRSSGNGGVDLQGPTLADAGPAKPVRNFLSPEFLRRSGYFWYADRL
jgi:hypothetical protein